MADGSSDLSAGYRAFISYSHKDTAWAKWLLARLESYRLRADLLPETEQPGKPTATRLGKFFRDRDEAGAATSLADEIRAALARSEHMIVVASPASAKSPYVEQEIREFASLNASREKPGNILTFIVAGEPNVSGDDARAALECFPKALRGGLTDGDGRPLEPLAADARSTGDGQTRALAKIVSGLTGIRYDALVRRDLQRRKFRQLMAAGIAAAVLVTAAGAGWRMEADRREKAELRAAQEQTDRDRRTLAAVNNAESAQRYLNRGNVRRAVELARKSLVFDGSLPFIPQAYSALYAALLQGGKPINMEITSETFGVGTTYGIGNGEYLTAGAEGRAVIWSPLTGVTYSRSDIDSSPLGRTRSPDGAAIFLKARSLDNYLRFSPGERRWDKVDLSPLRLGGELFAASLDSRTLVLCNLQQLMGVNLPERGDGKAQKAWEIDLQGEKCTAVAVSETGSLLVGIWGGSVIEYDKDTHMEVGRYASTIGAQDFIVQIDSQNGIIVARALQKVAVFRRGASAALLEFAKGIETQYLAPDGYHVIQSPISMGDSMIIHDIATGTQTSVKCFCILGGFNEDGDIVARESDVVVLRSLRDGSIIRTLFTFQQPINRLTYFVDGNFLLGERDLGMETTVPLDKEGFASFMSGGSNASGLISSAAYFDRGAIALGITHRRNNGDYEGEAVLLRRKSGGPPETVWRRGDIELRNLYAIGGGLIMLSSRGQLLENISIVDPATDKTIYEGSIESFEHDGTGRYLVLDTADDLAVFDGEARTITKTGLLPGDPAFWQNWFIAGERLYAVKDNTVKSVALGETVAAPRDHLTLSGHVLYSCYEPIQGSLYTLTQSEGKVTFSQLALSDGEPRKVQDFPENEASAEAFSLLEASKTAFISDVKKAVGCGSQVFEIRGADGRRLRWDIQASTVAMVAATPSGSDESFVNAPVDPASWNSARLTFKDKEVAMLAGDDGRRLARFDAEYVRVTAAVLLRKRGLVAAGLENGEVRVWSLTAPGAPLIEIKNHSDAVELMDVSPDETELLTADRNGTVYIWPLPEAAELLAMADARKDVVKSELTPPRN